jgi:hypothetical protein
MTTNDTRTRRTAWLAVAALMSTLLLVAVVARKSVPGGRRA